MTTPEKCPSRDRRSTAMKNNNNDYNNNNYYYNDYTSLHTVTRT